MFHVEHFSKSKIHSEVSEALIKLDFDLGSFPISESHSSNRDKIRKNVSRRIWCGIVGAGHAGSETAATAANLGSKTLLVTMSLQNIAQM
jgi:heterodisulfide reductase subunit A-like polyferredoxin